MERRLQLQNLQGMDPVTLHVSIADALGRPMRQIEPVSFLQLLAVVDADGLQANTQKDLEAFVERISREIGDIPSGESWSAFVAEYSALPIEKLPAKFRQVLATQLEARGEDAGDEVKNLLNACSEIEPESFALGAGTANIERSTRTAKPRGSADTSKPARAAKRTPRAKKEVDPVRVRFIRDLCMERLAGYQDKGLSEKVLLTGISFAARKTYSNITGAEIVGVLKTLETEGLVRRTAGRWIMGQFW